MLLNAISKFGDAVAKILAENLTVKKKKIKLLVHYVNKTKTLIDKYNSFGILNSVAQQGGNEIVIYDKNYKFHDKINTTEIFQYIQKELPTYRNLNIIHQDGALKCSWK